MFKSPHVRLLVSDFPACFRFYRDVLGMTSSFGTEDDVYADFSLGEDSLSLFKRDLMAEAIGTAAGPLPSDSVGRSVLAFASEDVDAAAQALHLNGVALVTEPTNRSEWGIRTAHFRDPDGNLIEVYSPLPASDA